MSAPSQIIRLCAGPEIPPSQQGRINVSWDLLLCHLMNGADIRGYIIEYSHTSGDKRNVSTSDIQIRTPRHPEYDHRYSCSLSGSSRLLQHGVTYTFRVAAQNRYGVGPFSDPVLGMIGITSIVIITANTVVVIVNIIICIGTTCISSEPNVASASPGYFTYTASSEVEKSVH